MVSRPLNAGQTGSLSRLSVSRTVVAALVMVLGIRTPGLGTRTQDRILKVAGTLADLEAPQDILTPHILEAIQCRSLDRSMWT